MSSIFINGSKWSVSSAVGAAIPVTAITNADPAVCSAAAPPADGSIIIITSGWSSLDQTVARTTDAAANAFSLESVDTTDVNSFPAGAGAGSVQVVTTWVELSQVRSAALTGGEQQFFQYQYLEDSDSRQRQKKTYKNAMVVTIGLDYDPNKSWYPTLQKADRSQEPLVLRQVLPNGDELYFLADASFQDVPTGGGNENQQNTLTLSLITKPIRYAKAGA